ncbi:hypothetical protein Tco_0632729 [Tanacetum coccineum]
MLGNTLEYLKYDLVGEGGGGCYAPALVSFRRTKARDCLIVLSESSRMFYLLLKGWLRNAELVWEFVLDPLGFADCFVGLSMYVLSMFSALVNSTCCDVVDVVAIVVAVVDSHGPTH